jgi:hypothetical protein
MGAQSIGICASHFFKASKEFPMYRFTRSVATKNAAGMATAIPFATEITAYLNKTYNMRMTVGVEMFGHNRIHWSYDAPTLDAMAEHNTKLMQDRTYWEILTKAAGIWLEGSMKDRVVKLIG